MCDIKMNHTGISCIIARVWYKKDSVSSVALWKQQRLLPLFVPSSSDFNVCTQYCNTNYSHKYCLRIKSPILL